MESKIKKIEAEYEKAKKNMEESEHETVKVHFQGIAFGLKIALEILGVEVE